MKKILALLAFVACLETKAQNVGIGVTTPAENLHVDSVIKVGKNVTLGTNGRKNLLKFGDGSYVTIGEEQADDKMYIRYGNLIFLQSAGSSGSGYIGVGTETPAANLDVNGTLRLRGNGAGAGKILTSDASGNATWQTPAETANIGFSATLTSNLSLVSGTAADVTGFTENFDDGNVFNPTTGRFTAPSAGVYQFTYNMNFLETGTDTKYVSIVVKKDGNLNMSFSHVSPGISSNWSSSYTNTFMMKLDQGDYITLNVTRSAVSSNDLRGGTGFANSTYFQGHKLY